MTVYEAELSAAGMTTVMVVSRPNRVLAAKLMEGASDCLIRHGADVAKIIAVMVPSVCDLPVVAKRVMGSGQVDAVLCLGVVVRGTDPEAEAEPSTMTRGIGGIALGSKKPLVSGVVVADTLEEAIERCGGKKGNRGYDAALALVELHNLPKILTAIEAS